MVLCQLFGFIKKVFVVAMPFLRCNALKYVLMNNQESEIRPEIKNINNNELLFYPYSILANRCSGSCSNINDPYVKLSVTDVARV